MSKLKHIISKQNQFKKKKKKEKEKKQIETTVKGTQLSNS